MYAVFTFVNFIKRSSACEHTHCSSSTRISAVSNALSSEKSLCILEVWLVCQLVGWSASWLVGLPIGRLVCQFVG